MVNIGADNKVWDWETAFDMISNMWLRLTMTYSLVGVGNSSWDTLFQLDVNLASIQELSAASRERLHGP